jgi:CRP-like cAMP-binding protein
MKEDLKKVPLFTCLEDNVLKKLGSITREAQFQEDEVIFEEGSPGDTLFIVEEGEVEIRKLIHKKEKKFKTLARLSSGDIFGEMALFDLKPRSASAYAVKKSVLLKIDGKKFQKFLYEDTKTASKLLSVFVTTLSRRLRQTNRELIALYETGKIIGERQDLRSLSKKILREILLAIPEIDAGLFAFFNEFGDVYEVLTQEGYSMSEDERFIDKNEPLVSEVMNSKKIVVINDLKRDERFRNLAERFYSGPSIMLCPIVVMDNIFGLVIVTNKTRANAFTSEDASLLTAVTSQVSGAFQHAKYAEEQENQKRLKRVFIR